jgi:hypothetical protein
MMANRPSPTIHVVLLTLLIVSGLMVAAPPGLLAAQTPAATPAAVEAMPPADGTPLAIEKPIAWTQLGPDGALIARAISDGDCPEVAIDGLTSSMTVRAGPSDDFPVSVCQTEIPATAGSVRVGKQALPLPADDPQRIVAIGDTGCRIREGNDVQACNDPAVWPFAHVATQAAAWAPDVVIHTGDYLYREEPCPGGNSGCAGSPFGDTWAAWQADFFAPAQPLLAAAPWIFLRGNHEDCSRSGEGWFRFLDPHQMPAMCRGFTDPYALDIGGQRAIVMDASSAQDLEPNDQSTAAFREQFGEIEQLAGGEPAWLLTHKAFWTLGSDEEGNAVEWTTATYTAAGYAQPPDAIELVLAGHVHMAQLLQFTEESGRPLIVVAGNAGTQLEWFDAGTFTGGDLGDDALIEGVRYKEHGFVGFELGETGWTVSVNMIDGTVPATCLISGKTLDCE